MMCKKNAAEVVNTEDDPSAYERFVGSFIMAVAHPPQATGSVDEEGNAVVTEEDSDGTTVSTTVDAGTGTTTAVAIDTRTKVKVAPVRPVNSGTNMLCLRIWGQKLSELVLMMSLLMFLLLTNFGYPLFC